MTSKLLPGVVFVVLLAFLGLFCGIILGALVVPEGQGLAAPGIVFGYGVAGSGLALVLGLILTRTLGSPALRTALVGAALAALLVCGWIAYRYVTVHQPGWAGAALAGTASPAIEERGAAADETREWVLYRNDALGYAIQYPAQWQPPASVEGVATAVLSGENGEKIEIRALGHDLNFSDNPTGAARSPLGLDQFMALAGRNAAFQRIHHTRLNAHPAYEIDVRTQVSRDNGVTYVEERAFMVLVESPRGEVVSLRFQNRANKHQLTAIERRMLSTFTFLE